MIDIRNDKNSVEIKEETNDAKFSVLMSVYKNTVASQLRECIMSMLSQTRRASQLVLVVDGEINNELRLTIEQLREDASELDVVSLEKNVGLGEALSFGLTYCKYDLVARMDTDDIARNDRFEKQLRCFSDDDKLSIVGSNIAEFIGTIDNIVSYRYVPVEHLDICLFMQKRCPFNHMTVMFKKSEVELAGGYKACYYNEDSYLWVRMYLAGAKFKNINENLVYARIDDNTFQRRGGLRYYRSERDLFKFMREKEIIGSWSYLKSKIIRYIVYVLTPNSLRAYLFRKAVRIEPGEKADTQK
jgi:glycosyltransferase involved in cell wall biosynthesis